MIIIETINYLCYWHISPHAAFVFVTIWQLIMPINQSAKKNLYLEISLEARIANSMYHTNEKREFQIMNRFIWHLFVGDIRWFIMCLCKHVERTMDEPTWPFNDQGWSHLGYKSPYQPSGESSRGEAWIIAGTQDVIDSGRPYCIGKFHNMVVRINFCILPLMKNLVAKLFIYLH